MINYLKSVLTYTRRHIALVLFNNELFTIKKILRIDDATIDYIKINTWFNR